MKPTQRVAIAVVQHQDLWLVGRRPPGVPLEMLWEFPGGKLRTAESPTQAAQRECFEETGLQVRVAELLRQFEHEYPHGAVSLWFFLCHPVAVEPRPRAPFQFVTRARLLTLQMPAANRPILRRLRASQSVDGNRPPPDDSV